MGVSKFSYIKKLLGLGPKPVIAKSRYITIEEAKMAPFTKKTRGQGYGTLMRPDVYYIVASVELGNTTTKCILTATILNTSRTFF